MQRFYFLVISILASLCLSETYAVSFNLDSIATKGKFAKFCVNTYHWVDKTFNGTDTAYVQSTSYKWNVKFRTSSWLDFNDFYFNRDHQIRMQSPFCSSIGGDIQFMAVALGYDINVNRLFRGKDRSKSKFNFEFSSGLVTARLYSINNNDGMNVSNVTGIDNLKFDYEGINSLIWGIDAIFVFNPRRYSNSAILSFGKIQNFVLLVHEHGIRLGEHVFVNANCTFLDGAYITIGYYTLVGPDVKIYTPHHPMDYIASRESKEYAYPVTIGNRCVIGAGSVVTKDVADDSVVAGNPAKIIRQASDGAEELATF